MATEPARKTRDAYTEAEALVSEALLDVWDRAEIQEVEGVAELCKAALAALGLPWVSIAEGQQKAGVR